MRKPLRRLGKKGRCWQRVRAELKLEAEAENRTTCECTFPHQCWYSNGLSWAHSLKRRNITTEEQLREAILSCPSAHAHLEALPKEEMYRIVREIIAARSVAESGD